MGINNEVIEYDLTIHEWSRGKKSVIVLTWQRFSSMMDKTMKLFGEIIYVFDFFNPGKPLIEILVATYNQYHPNHWNLTSTLLLRNKMFFFKKLHDLNHDKAHFVLFTYDFESNRETN